MSTFKVGPFKKIGDSKSPLNAKNSYSYAASNDSGDSVKNEEEFENSYKAERIFGNSVLVTLTFISLFSGGIAAIFIVMSSSLYSYEYGNSKGQLLFAMRDFGLDVCVPFCAILIISITCWWKRAIIFLWILPLVMLSIFNIYARQSAKENENLNMSHNIDAQKVAAEKLLNSSVKSQLDADKNYRESKKHISARRDDLIVTSSNVEKFNDLFEKISKKIIPSDQVVYHNLAEVISSKSITPDFLRSLHGFLVSLLTASAGVTIPLFLSWAFPRKNKKLVKKYGVTTDNGGGSTPPDEKQKPPKDDSDHKQGVYVISQTNNSDGLKSEKKPTKPKEKKPTKPKAKKPTKPEIDYRDDESRYQYVISKFKTGEIKTSQRSLIAAGLKIGSNKAIEILQRAENEGVVIKKPKGYELASDLQDKKVRIVK